MHRLAITLLILHTIAQIAVGQDVDKAGTTSQQARLRLCYEIADTSNNVDTVIKYTSEGIMLCTEKDSSILAKLYQYAGWASCYSEKYDDAITLYQKAIAIYEKMEQYGSMCVCYSNMSQCHFGLNNTTETWKCLYNSLKMAQKSGDTATICNCYNEIANMYIENDMFVQAQETAHKSLKLSTMTNNYGEMGNSASLLSLTYNNDDTTNIKTGIHWGRLAESYFGRIDDFDSYYDARLIDTYCNLITLYTRLRENTGAKRYADSVAYYYGKITEYSKNNDIPDAEYWTSISLIQLKYAQQDYKGALSELDNVLKMTHQQGYSYYDNIIYELLYKTYQKIGDHYNAYKYIELYKQINRKKINAQAAAEAAAFDARTSVEHENEMLLYERKLADTELESSRQHFQKIATAVSICIAAISVIIIVIILMLRNARKTNEKLSMHREEIKAQNEMILNEKEILADKHKKILQSMTYARRIQLATICSDHELQTVFPGAMAYYRPRELVSGDWYWAAGIGRKKILAVGGSARHGVPGALVAMITLNTLKDTMGQLSPMSPVSPVAILRTVQSKLPTAALSNDAGVSLCVFVRNRIKFASINQNAMLIKDGQPIVMKGNQTDDTNYDIHDGDFVIAYSASTRREMLSITQQTDNFCIKLSTMQPAEQRKTIDDILAKRRQSEDVTAVSVRITTEN